MKQATEQNPLRYNLMLRLYAEEKCFGPGIASLLRGVEQTHSLRQAAIRMDMAYSKAWRILKTSEENLGFALLNSSTGGRGGGGAELTDAARDLLGRYDAFSDAVRNFADEAFLEYFG